MYKVLLLADINSDHTLKWATALMNQGFKVGIFSLTAPIKHAENNLEDIKVFTAQRMTKTTSGSGFFQKLMYLGALPSLRSCIKNFRPDLVHAHYASSYGLLGALTNFKPFLLSVWGSDVYDFPKASFLHRAILSFNLKKAEIIFSTSKAMVAEINKYSKKEIVVIPFGIDLQTFKRLPAQPILFNEGDIVIGTVKSLEKKYGINFLIKSFSALKIKHPELPLKLLIVGGGSEEKKLKDLCKQLRITEYVHFTGKIQSQHVPSYHNMITINVSLSVDDSESFGVSALEASACEKPLIVSAVAGFKETVVDNVTGFIVPPRNIRATVASIEKLLFNKGLQTQMGLAGRNRVELFYDLEQCVHQLVGIYKTVI